MVATDSDSKENGNVAVPPEKQETKAPAEKQNAKKIPKDKPYEFYDLHENASSDSSGNIDFILDIPLVITVELGRTEMLVDELLKLAQGSVIELSKLSGKTLDVLANQKLIARGEVVVVNDKYGIRLTEIVRPMERVEKLK